MVRTGGSQPSNRGSIPRSAIQDSANCADKIFKGTVSSRLYPYFFDEGFEDITASFSILETFSQ